MQRAQELDSDAQFGWDVYTNDPGEVAPDERETRVPAAVSLGSSGPAHR